MEKGSMRLSYGCLTEIVSGKHNGSPILLQVVTVKHKEGDLSIPNSVSRYKGMLSDGTTQQKFGMITPNLGLTNFAIILVTSYEFRWLNVGKNNECAFLFVKAMTIIHPQDFDMAEDTEQEWESDFTIIPQSTQVEVQALARPIKKEVDMRKTPPADIEDIAEILKVKPKLQNIIPAAVVRSSTNYRSDVAGTSKPKQNLKFRNVVPLSISTLPIADIDPFAENYTIRAEVTHKSAIIRWTNANGSGELLKFTLRDSSGAIEATAFNKQASQYNDFIAVGSEYYIKGFSVKETSQRFPSMYRKYELTVGANSNIEFCPEELDIASKSHTTIREILLKKPGSSVDFIALCKRVQPVVNITEEGVFKTSREIALTDRTGATVVLLLGGEQAASFTGVKHSVLLIKQGRIDLYHGVNAIGISRETKIKINPDVEEAHMLRKWAESSDNAVNLRESDVQQHGKKDLKVEGKSNTLKTKEENTVIVIKPKDYPRNVIDIEKFEAIKVLLNASIRLRKASGTPVKAERVLFSQGVIAITCGHTKTIEWIGETVEGLKLNLCCENFRETSLLPKFQFDNIKDEFSVQALDGHQTLKRRIDCELKKDSAMKVATD